MSVGLRVEALRNKNSQAIFVLVDQSQYNKVTVINPEGKILTVPDGLFDPPFPVSADKFTSVFTAAQVAALEKQVKRPKAEATTRRRTSTASRKMPARFGIGAEWSAAKLTFYKHKIEPLDETQSFKIDLENEGTFVITKSDFCRFFNDVIISTSYWQDGAYTYVQLPDKARKFIKSA